MPMSTGARLGRHQKAIVLFLLMVLLPSVAFAILIARAVRSEQSQAAERKAGRQREIARLIEADLNAWLFSAQPESALSDALFRFRREGDRLVFPEYGLSLPSSGSPPRPPNPTPPRDTPSADVINDFYYPRILVFLRDFKSGAQYFLRLKAMIVLLPNEREGYALDAQRILNHVSGRLTELCTGESFRASLWIGDIRDDRPSVTTGAYALEGFSFFQVVFSDAAPAGVIGYRDHLFAYSMSLVVLVAILGSLLVYRGVFQESRLSQLRSDFVSAVSHEFRSPLSSILALSERLEASRLRDPEQQAEYFRIIRHEARRLSALVTRLLDFAQIEGGKKRYAFERVNLTSVAREAVQSCRDAGRPDRIAITADDTTRWVEADPTALQHCIQNLIENALKYSPPDSRVTVGCWSANGTHAVDVQDRGIGIPRDEQVKVFEKFYRGRQAAELDSQGVGIGLALVKHVVESHGGSVTVESTVGTGSRFSLTLPRAKV